DVLGRAPLVARPTRFAGGAPQRLPKALAADLAADAAARDAITVAARITVADLDARGPARIVSFSRDPFNRNFDLGQANRSLAFRVRTPTTGLNGNDLYAKTRPLLEANRYFVVVATYDGEVSRIYVDGRLEGRANLAARQCAVPVLCDVERPFALGAFGASLAVVGFVLVPTRRAWTSVLVPLVAGSIGFALLLSLGAVDLSAGFWFHAPWLVAGAVGTAASLHPIGTSTHKDILHRQSP